MSDQETATASPKVKKPGDLEDKLSSVIPVNPVPGGGGGNPPPGEHGEHERPRK